MSSKFRVAGLPLELTAAWAEAERPWLLEYMVKRTRDALNCELLIVDSS